MVDTTAKTNDTASVKKQVEYYLSDSNLARDKFFREQIQANKEGWVNIGHFLNCNKIKVMKLKSEEIAEACHDSDALDVSTDKLKIRRKDNKALPEASEMRKRDAKAGDKRAGGMEKGGQQ